MLDEAYDTPNIHPTPVNSTPTVHTLIKPHLHHTTTIPSPIMDITSTTPMTMNPLITNLDINDQRTIRLLQKALTKIQHPTKPYRIQLDGGANRSIINDITILTNF